jgi:hypothetical protein
MSWLFSQVLVEEYLGENFSDGEQSVPSNGNHIQQAYLQPDKMTKFSRVSRFGMTFRPLMESRGEELLTLYLAGFHAKTSAQPEKEMVLTESEAECGEKWHGLLARYDQDTHSWRTVQCSLLEDLNESLQTLPQWGMTVGGELYLLPTLVQTTDESESGSSEKHSLPTPTCNPHMPNKNANTKGLKNLVEVAEGKWEHLMPKQKLPTPRSCSAMAATLTDKGDRFPNLETVVARMDKTTVGGKLNPMWVEWLMGWTLGWTDLKPLETDKYHYARQQHGKY